MSYVHRVSPGDKFRLRSIDPDEHARLDRAEGERETLELGKELGELYDLLYEAGQHALLIVLQGRDTAGKDGLIHHLLSCMNAQSCRVVPFKVPTPQELSHDFLWRAHGPAPGKGSSAIFNRSHYEDVIVVRVHNLVPEAEWRKRYDQINQFEELLAGANTIVMKFCLHISRDEQKQRLLDREKDADKSWKLSLADWKERDLWDEYEAAYDEALRRCSTAAAPWHIVPANHKWFRNLAVTEALVKALRPHRSAWHECLAALGKQMKRELEAYRAEHRSA